MKKSGMVFVVLARSTSLRGFFCAAFLIALGLHPQSASAASTTTTLSVTTTGSTPATTISAGTVITLTATVASGSTPVNPGLILFCETSAGHCTDVHVIGTQQLQSTGVAVMKYLPGVGTHSYQAIFVGTKTETTSSSASVVITVAGTHSGPYPTTTSLAQSGVAGNYTLTATVASLTDAVPRTPPTGTVSFLNQSTGNSFLAAGLLQAPQSALAFLNTSNPQALSTVGGEPVVVAIVSGDFNGDGIPDFITLNVEYYVEGPSDSNLTVFLGNGDGTFTALAGPEIPQATLLTAGDFNGDGKLDLIVDVNGLQVLIGNGDGTFTLGVNVKTSPSVSGGTLSVGDFNGDGNADLVSSGPGLVFLGDGKGNFTLSAQNAGAGQFDQWKYVGVGDFNNDGIQDLAVVTTGAVMEIWLGSGDGTFTLSSQLAAKEIGPLAIADFNDDGDLDLAAVNSFTSVNILLGDGHGNFTLTQTLSNFQNQVIEVGDFNGDHVPDLIGLSEINAEPMVLVGNGDGTFSVMAGQLPEGQVNSVPTLALADFNGDGRTDAAIPFSNPNVFYPEISVYLSAGQVAIATQSGISPSGSGSSQVVANYPGDGSYGSSESTPLSLTDSAVQAVLSASSLIFGNEGVNLSTLSQSVTLTSGGTVPLVIRSIALTGANAGSFITSNNCPSTLAVGAKCTMGVRFAPPTTGSMTAAVTLTDNAPGSPQNIILSGTGVSVSPTTLSLSATTLTFPSVGVGISTASQAVSVTNTGASTAYFGLPSSTLSGPNASSFVTSNTCGSSLEAGASCIVGVREIPRAAGPLKALLSLTDTAGNSPQSITLNGTGIGAIATFTPASVNFGSEGVGYSTASVSVLLGNVGYLPLYLNGARITGPNASSFATSNTCSLSAPVYGSDCHIGVRFAPQAAGALSAFLTVSDTAGDSPQNIPLSGLGVAAPLASLTLAPSSVSFGSVSVNTSTASQSVVVTNAGSAIIYFNSIALGGANSSSFITSNTCGTSLAAGSSCRIGVRFLPLSTGTLTAVITLTDNSATSPQTISLSGTGK